MNNLYRGPYIDASYQVSVHLAKGVSEEKIKMWFCYALIRGRPVKSKSHPYTEVCTKKYTNVVTIQLIFHNPLSYVSGHIGP
jgi:hypothetical protein